MNKLKVGQSVFVVDGFLDDYGECGLITELNYDARCGNLKDDPLVTVKFEDGHSDGFWAEELALEKPEHPKRCKPRLYIHSIG